MNAGFTHTGPLELTILMPCLNEAETVATCVANACKFLKDNDIEGEVLVADNGSTDGSQDLAAKSGARVVSVSGRGYGSALIGGIEAARSHYLIMGDADDSYDFLSVMPFVERLRAGDDFVIGNRFKGEIKPGAMPFLHRYLGNPALSFLARLFFRVPVGDFHCGLRGFKRDAARRLNLVSLGMELASEMIVKAALTGHSFSEVPITLSADGRSRAPHLRTWRDGWRHLRFLLLHSPKWLFFYPGVAALLTGLFGIVMLARGGIQIAPHVVLDIHSLVFASFAVLVGAQLISLAVLAQRYAASEGFLPPTQVASDFIERLSLEVLLRIAGVIFVLGAAGVIWAISLWAGSNFGPISYSGFMRVVVVSLTALTLAIQIASNAFLASIFTIRVKS
jgi:hypothetical protein